MKRIIYTLVGMMLSVGAWAQTSLQDQINSAESGSTVTLSGDVTLEARIDINKNITVDLDSHTITTTATCGNGSAFNVVSGTVTIQNGTIDASFGEANSGETDAITARSGSDVTLKNLNVTVKSKNGACAYAFEGSKITIESGHYENQTTEPYQYNANITAMLVNQANVATQLIFIKGGTFKGYDPTLGDDSQTANENATFLAEGVALKKDVSGNYTTTTAVAKIGGKNYATIKDAITAATEGVTIKMLADAEENITVPAGKNIILDINDKTLNGKQTANAPTIKNQGTLTLKNGNVRRAGEGSASYYVIENEGTITMDEGLNVEGSASSSLIRNNAATAQMTFNAGTYTQTGAFIVVKNDLGTVEINGGTFSTASDKNVLNNWDQMTINGGTFTGNILNGAYDTDNNKLTINDGTFNTNQIRTYLGNGKTTCPIEIKGGTFTNDGMKYVGTGNKETDTDVQVVVSGGTFANPVPEKYCANGFVPTKNADGTYGVEEGEYVAQVGEKQYTSLAVAVAEAEEGATVTLLTNVTLAQCIEPGKNMTIDLNGKKITTTATCSNGSAFDVKGGNVVIKNGTIDGTQVTETECDAITARSGANVTLQDLNITVDSKNGACAYAFDGAKITIESGYYENKTTETYQWNASITAMVVNQANVATQLIEIKGGTFKGYDPAMGDDSQLSNENHTFLAPGFYTEKNADGTYGLMDEYTVNDGIAFKSLVKPAIVKTATYSRTMPMETTWGTVCLPFSLKQGDGNTTPKLYTFGSISAETLTVTEVENEVAPGIAVIFSYSGSGKAVFATTDAKVNTTVVPSSETLVGTFEEQTITNGLGNIYFINGNKFHQAKVSLTVPAYRAYINYAGSTNAKPSVLNINIADSDNDIDGIAGVTLDELNSTDAIYDANGCKLSAPQKGLNIMKLASGKTVKLIIK